MISLSIYYKAIDIIDYNAHICLDNLALAALEAFFNIIDVFISIYVFGNYNIDKRPSGIANFDISCFHFVSQNAYLTRVEEST